MGREVSQRADRMCAAWSALCAVALIHLAPLLTASPSVTSDLIVLSVGMIAAAAAAGAVRRLRPVTVRRGILPTPAREASPVLRGRATDPQHHPLAPRAPGLA